MSIELPESLPNCTGESHVAVSQLLMVTKSQHASVLNEFRKNVMGVEDDDVGRSQLAAHDEVHGERRGRCLPGRASAPGDRRDEGPGETWGGARGSNRGPAAHCQSPARMQEHGL